MLNEENIISHDLKRIKNTRRWDNNYLYELLKNMQDGHRAKAKGVWKEGEKSHLNYKLKVNINLLVKRRLSIKQRLKAVSSILTHSFKFQNNKYCLLLGVCVTQ